jgi:hypothetical protein
MTGLVARRITLTATHLMNTEQLILNLSADVPRVYRHALIERIASGVGGGALVALMLVVAILGVRPDLQHAMQAFSFWMKWAYTISLGAGALYAVIRLSRPTPSSLCGLWLLAVPILLLIGVGIGELANTSRSVGALCAHVVQPGHAPGSGGWGNAGAATPALVGGVTNCRSVPYEGLPLRQFLGVAHDCHQDRFQLCHCRRRDGDL